MALFWTLRRLFDVFLKFVNKMKKKLGTSLVSIRFDHEIEFKNAKFQEYCATNRVAHNFFVLRTPQLNRVVKRKNKTFEDISRAMMIAETLIKIFRLRL